MDQGQLHRTHDHHLHGEDPHHHAALHSVTEEGDQNQNQNQHGEKKSVLTKVKNKAKKIKDKIKHAGHSHDDNDDDEFDYEEDEETVNRPHLHAAPVVSGSDFISGTALPKQTGLNLENPTVPQEDRLAAPTARDHDAYDDVRNVGVTTGSKARNVEDDPLMKTPSPPLQGIFHHNPNIGAHDYDFPGATGRERVGPQPPSGTQDFSSATDVGIGREKVGPRPPVGTQDFYGTTDVGIARDRERVGPQLPVGTTDVGIGREKAAGTQDFYDATDVGIGREKVGLRPHVGRDSDSLPTSVDPTVKIGPLEELEVDLHGPKASAAAVPPSNYQSKVADPAGLGGGEADVTPLLKRLDNFHVDDDDESEKMDYTGSHEQFAPEPIPAREQFSPKSFDAERPESMPQDTVAGKISASTSVVTDKAVAAKNAVASKLGYGGGTVDREEMEVEVDRPPKASLMDKAVAAKDAVASKFGYGGSTLDREEMEVDVDRPPRASLTETVSEYGHKVAEQLAPVYEKAAGAGSAIMSKVPGLGGGGVGEEGTVVGKESDRGVSVQSYLVEKLRPGEEDRELSKAITEAIHGKKEGAQRTGEEHLIQQQPVQETVTVEAVAADEKAAAGVVDRVKGAIGSWLGKKGDGNDDGGEGLEKEIVSKLQE